MTVFLNAMRFYVSARALGIDVSDKVTKALTVDEEDEVGVITQVCGQT
jgi:hypothetical protein